MLKPLWKPRRRARLGGAFLGDKYQGALFENPGRGAHWVSLKLVGAARTARRSARASV